MHYAISYRLIIVPNTFLHHYLEHIEKQRAHRLGHFTVSFPSSGLRRHFRAPLQVRWCSFVGHAHLLNSRRLALTKSFGDYVMAFLMAGTFNYDENFKGATSKSISSLKEDKQLKEAGFSLNHARVLVGSGMETFEKGKAALQTWRHFQFNWTFVDSATPIKTGVKFCVCVNEFLPWLMMPLQIAYVDEDKRAKKGKASFSYGSGTLQGHLLAGEERFSLELNENDQVWYEILSFSKPAHLLSFIGYPYVLHRQKCFTKESTKAVLKHCSV
ncbi:UPF0548 protein-like protein [Drosera capensis]